MQISISIDRILREIYALSALRAFNAQNRETIPILTPDQRRALTALASDSIAHIAISLHGFITAIDFSDSHPETLEIVNIDFNTTNQQAATAIIRALEVATVHLSLSTILFDHAPATARLHQQRADTSIDNIRFLASQPPQSFPFTFQPHS